MVELSRDDLFTLEEYSEKRSSFRSVFWMKKRIEVSW